MQARGVYGLEVVVHCGDIFQLGAKGKGKKEKVVEASSLVEVKG